MGCGEARLSQTAPPATLSHVSHLSASPGGKWPWGGLSAAPEGLTQPVSHFASWLVFLGGGVLNYADR